jgi:hypothetical protein
MAMLLLVASPAVAVTGGCQAHQRPDPQSEAAWIPRQIPAVAEAFRGGGVHKRMD